jgi:hypothetical protein
MARLQTIHIITVFVVDIDSIKLLILDNVYKTGGELLFFSEAVVPAVIVISCSSKKLN